MTIKHFVKRVKNGKTKIRKLKGKWQNCFRHVIRHISVNLKRYRLDFFFTHIQQPLSFNPRPDTVFCHLRSDRGGCDPLGVSKRSVVELSGKDQQIALAEYSRLVVLFLVLGQYLTQLWQVKG